jgi:undecaprenyl-diphosphatase
MAGAALVSVLSAYLCFREQGWYMNSIYRWTMALYRRLFSLPIRLGWVRP